MNLDGWEIDVEALRGADADDGRISYQRDVIFPSPDNSHAVVFYAIYELRMGWDVGRVAAFARSGQASSGTPPCEFCLLLHRRCHHLASERTLCRPKILPTPVTSRINVPFALIDLSQSRYSFVPLINSYSYGLAPHGGQIQVVEHRRDERFRSHDGQQHDMDELTWYDLCELDGSIGTTPVMLLPASKLHQRASA